MSSLTLLEHDCAVLQRIWPDTFPKSLSCCYLKDSPALCLDGRVTKLTMNFGRGNTTDNAVPNDIAALTGLKTLQLGNNGYTSIPDGVFDNLTALEWLDLYGNNFGGKPIPSSIGNLANLVDLNFGYSGVGGEIPRSLEKLDKLYFLNLNGNTLTGVIPPGFSNLKSLHTFEFASNPLLTGPLPDLNMADLYYCVGNRTSVCITDGHKGKDCFITAKCNAPVFDTTMSTTTASAASATAGPVAPSATASVASSATTGVPVAVSKSTTTASGASATAGPAAPASTTVPAVPAASTTAAPAAKTTTTVASVVVAPTTTASAAAAVVITTTVAPVVVVPGATTTVAAVYGQPSAAPSPSPSGGASIYGTGDKPAGETYTKHTLPGGGDEPILSGAATTAASVVSVVAALLVPLALF